MESLKFEKEYYIHVYETGPDGKLNIYSLFNFMQDIASDHAEKLGFGRDDLMRDNKFWVLSRMYTEISEWPLWEDKIIMKTWPSGTEKLFALRHYEIISPNGRKIGSGSSSWLILDRTTRKVQRPDYILSHFNQELIPVPPVRNAEKIDAAAEQGVTSPCFRIRISDLDINLHTNNARYLNWIYDTYDLEFLMKNDLQSTEINYLAESKYGEDIKIITSAEIPNFINHSIYRINDDKELCRVRMEWKKSNLN